MKQMVAEVEESRSRLQTLNGTVLLIFLIVALALVFWSVIRRPVILAREDNPRLVEAELRIQRGRILDRNNIVLAETVGPPDELRRLYPVPAIGPAVGYYSFRHGTSGVEEGLDEVLRGSTADFWSDFLNYQVLHRPQTGRDVRLTLDARWQQAAEALLGEQRGAVLLITLPDAAILAMASHPGYDPNRLDERFEELAANEHAPLLNRVTQGQYQPGLVLQPFILAAALDEGLIDLNEEIKGADERVMIGGVPLRCADAPPEPATWVDALRQRCPAAMLSLVKELEATDLRHIFADFGLLSTPDLSVAAEAATGSTVDDPRLAVVGQENLTVSPLQVALALAALANQGQVPRPQLVLAVEDENGEWQPQPGDAPEDIAVSTAAADAILDALPQQDGLIEHATLVLSGPQQSTNAWYLGLGPAGAARYAVVVVVEDSAELFDAQQVGRSLLKMILFPAD